MDAQPTADLIIADRGGGNPRRLIGADLACSWAVSNAGTLSCRVPTSDVTRAGLGFDLRGKFVAYEHPTAGKWGGTVTASPRRDGILEVAAQGFALNLRKRVISGTWSGPPGNILQQAFAQANNGGPTYVTLGTIDGSGAAMEGAYAFDDFYESVLPSITADVGFEWHVSPTGILTFGQRIGVDLQSTVRLEQGREILNEYSVDDMYALTNRIIAGGTGSKTTTIPGDGGGKGRGKNKGKKKRKKKSGSGATTSTAYYPLNNIARADAASVARFGALEEYINFGVVGDDVGLANRAQQYLAERSGDFSCAFELTIADINGAFSKLREGNTISVAFGLSGVSGIMRIMDRALDLNSNTLTIAGNGKLGA